MATGVIIEEKLSKTPGDNNVKKYLRGKMIGKGGFAKCYEITNLETKKLQAVKIIAKNTLTKSRARQKVLSTPYASSSRRSRSTGASNTPTSPSSNTSSKTTTMFTSYSRFVPTRL